MGKFRVRKDLVKGRIARQAGHHVGHPQNGEWYETDLFESLDELDKVTDNLFEVKVNLIIDLDNQFINHH